jgi:hypothetical protein
MKTAIVTFAVLCIVVTACSRMPSVPTAAPTPTKGPRAYFPPGPQGCTPGYWKQPNHFDSWPAPYTPTTLFDTVFADAFPGLTLLDVLNLEGGGLNALGRHTVAALLNSASGFGLFLETLQWYFDNFYNSELQEFVKNNLEEWNEAGCPLD